jgi:hypothetical protein
VILRREVGAFASSRPKDLCCTFAPSGLSQRRPLQQFKVEIPPIPA